MRLADLAYFYRKTQKYDQARAPLEQALKIRIARLGHGHPYVVDGYRALALIAAQQGQWQAAYDYAKAAIGMVVAHENVEYQRRTETWSAGEPAADEQLFSLLVRAAWHIGLADAKTARQVFLAAQQMQRTKAARTVMKTAARTLSAGPSADLFREREALLDQLQSSWNRLTRADVETATLDTKERSQTLRNLLGLVKELEQRLSDLDRRLGRSIVDYAAFAGLTALDLGEAASLLGNDRMLLQILELPAVESLPADVAVIALGGGKLRFFRSDLKGTPLKAMVATLRCGLDREGEWERKTGKHRAPACAALQPQGIGASDDPPFSLADAHALFEALLGPIREDIKNKHLLVVASGSLSTLPLHVLVTEPAKVAVGRKEADFRGVAWLARRHAVTAIPSVASLKALATPRSAENVPIAYLGFGNPLLEGNSNDRDEVVAAATAKALRTCVDVDGAPRAAAIRARALRLGLDELLQSRKDIARIEIIRAQAPLWETARELCDVAKSLGAIADRVYLGARATEKAIKQLDQSGQLRNARILHFATHAFLAADTEWARIHSEGRGEAALLLTPPPPGTSERELTADDGLLTVSEIAQLKINGDWVILSACNTAGEDRVGGEALSGLARAFFLAGARALLASHWYVDSDAATHLVSGIFRELARDPRITRAEALRRSMQILFDRPSGPGPHPAYWAPFVVIGGAGD